MKEQIALQNALQSRLHNLRIRYPKYSVRAFAKKAGISPTTLSLILQGKRKVSQKLAQQLSERLLFDPQERAEVFKTFLIRKPKTADPGESQTYVQLTVDQYQLISDWRAFALLNLIETKDFHNKHSWIAKRLGISIQDVRETIGRLKRLDMLIDGNDQLKRKVSKYRTTEDLASMSLRKSHQQTLDLAHASLEKDAIELRDFSWMTFPFDTQKMATAKELIRKFQDDLLEIVGEESSPNEVYRLAIQLFPLTKT